MSDSSYSPDLTAISRSEPPPTPTSVGAGKRRRRAPSPEEQERRKEWGRVYGAKAKAIGEYLRKKGV